MLTLTSLLTTALPFVVAVLEIVPSLTALLWATATFTKSQPTGRAVWNSYFSHVPQYESLASVFYSSMEYWVGYTADAIPRSTIDPILASYKELCSHYQAGLHAWRLPPHTLAYNLYTHIFSMYALDSLLLEGFGAGAYSAAVAARLAYRPPSRAEYSKFDCVLTCLGGVAMPPKIFQELLDVYYTAHSLQLELANDSAAKGHVYDESSFTHSLRIVQHVHDRISPWCLNEILLNYLYNRGVAVLTLHDGVDEKRAYAELHNQIPFQPWSHFGDYRHNYEKVVPTLKYFSAATFFASFLAPLTYEQLEAREGTLGATYCPDLLDLLLGLFSYMGIVPPLHFGLTPSLRFFYVAATASPMVTSSPCSTPLWRFMKVLKPSTPVLFCNSSASRLLKIWVSHRKTFTPWKIACDRLSRTSLYLKRWISFTLSCLVACVFHRLSAGTMILLLLFCLLLSNDISSGHRATPDPPPEPPSFHVWITHKVAPHMAVVDLRCDAVPWACFRRGPTGQHQFGIHAGNFIQFALGAYVLSQHRTKVSSSLSSADDVSMQDEPHTLRINQSSLLTPPAVIKHQAKQIANARRRAAEGSLAPYTIPLLANTQTRSSKNRVTWTSNSRCQRPRKPALLADFLQFQEGMAQAGHMPLKGRCAMLTPSTTNTKPPHFFLTLTSSHCQTLGLHIPESIKAWLLSGAPRIYDRRDLELPGNRQIALPSILMRYFCSELTIQQFEALLRGKQAENDKELDAAATECRKMKRPKQALARLPHPAASSTSTSAPLAPAPLGNTPPPSPRIPDTERSRTPPPDRPRPIGMPPGPPVPAPPRSRARTTSPSSSYCLCRL